MVLVTIQTVNSSWLYIKSKDFIPGKPESLYEVGYMLLKRSSIFLISSVLLFNSFGLDMVYFITFANTTGTVVKDIFEINGTDYSHGFNKYLTEKTFWVLVLGVVILPICLKKEL